MHRRTLLKQLFACALLSPLPSFAAPTNGERLAAAAHSQIGVTTTSDPNYTRISYPNGDVPRSTGVCADVIIRAARDGLALHRAVGHYRWPNEPSPRG